ncbi:hypothetical protein GCM10009784_24180 [Arthrobacter parietis]|uniref:Uncharacterized protein n=1 Tax=Arthrobacter parietis TaxID=271434 RepID=A0ABP5MPY7_9MICC
MFFLIDVCNVDCGLVPCGGEARAVVELVLNFIHLSGAFTTAGYGGSLAFPQQRDAAENLFTVTEGTGGMPAQLVQEGLNVCGIEYCVLQSVVGAYIGKLIAAHCSLRICHARRHGKVAQTRGVDGAPKE